MSLRQASPVTICIPSNRPLSHARGPLESAIVFAASRNYRVVISDNSGEASKYAHFGDVPDHVTYLADKELSPTENLVACLRNADTDFVLMMGDDDYVYAVDGEAAFDFSSIAADVAGVRPRMEVFAVGEGVLRTDTYTIDAEGAADRVYEYRTKVNGDNTFYYSYFRRDDFGEIAGLLLDHPSAKGDMDWALVYSLLSNGKVLYDGSTRFRYDIGKWRQAEGVGVVTEAIYKKAGLPDEARAFERLFRFMDCYVFAFRRTSRLSEIERIRLLYCYATVFLGDLFRKAASHPNEFSGFEHEIAMLQAVTKGPDDYLVNVFEVCARIADRLKQGLYDKYINWFVSVQNHGQA